MDNVLRIARALERCVNVDVANSVIELAFPDCSWGTTSEEGRVTQVNVNYVLDGVLWDIVWTINGDGVCDIRCTRWIEEEEEDEG